MRAVWQVTPEDRFVPQWSLLREYGINRIYFAALHRVWSAETAQFEWVANSRQVDPDYKATVEANRFQYGVFRDPHWTGLSDPLAIARAADQDIRDFGNGTGPYMLDMEYGTLRDDLDAALRVFFELRKMRPTRKLAWTLEANKGALFTRELVAFVNADPNLMILPQAFDGDMRPYDPETVRQNVISAGVRADRVLPMLDGKLIAKGAAWSGTIFHAERLAP